MDTLTIELLMVRTSKWVVPRSSCLFVRIATGETLPTFTCPDIITRSAHSVDDYQWISEKSVSMFSHLE